MHTHLETPLRDRARDPMVRSGSGAARENAAHGILSGGGGGRGRDQSPFAPPSREATPS